MTNGTPQDEAHVIQRLDHPSTGELARVQQDNGAPALPLTLDGPIEAPPRRRLARVLWRGSWLMALGIAAGLGGAYLYLKHATPLYTSAARLLITDATPVIPDGRVAVTMDAMPASLEIVRSLPVMSAAATEAGAATMRTFAGVDDIPSALRSALTIEPDPKSESIVDLSIDTPYAAEGKQLLDGVISAYMKFLSAQRQSSTTEAIALLKERLTAVDADETTTQNQATYFRQKNPSISSSSNGSNPSDIRMASLTAELDQAKLQETNWRLQLADAKAALDTPDGAMQYVNKLMVRNELTGLDDYTIAHEQYVTAQHEYDKVSSELQGATNNPRLAVAGAQVDVARTRLYSAAKETTQLHLDHAQAMVEGVIAEEKSLTASTQALQNEISEQSSSAADLAALQNHLLACESQRTELDKKINDLRVTAQSGGLTSTVIDAPRVALQPSSPNWLRCLGSGAFVGFILGVAGAFLQAGVDERIRNTDEAVHDLGMPILGVVPHISSRTDNDHRARAVQLEPSSAVAEAYRAIRTSLYFGSTFETFRQHTVRGPKRLLITSPLAGEGKSTLASNLAIAMAQAGQRVALLDADIRRPTQLFNQNLEAAACTLIDVMQGREPLSRVVMKTSTKNLYVLSCGPVPHGIELLALPAFGQVLDRLNSCVDVVVIDAPPVLPVSDARILAAGCDATVLVLRAGHSTRQLARESFSRLISVGARMVGVVLTDVRAGAEYGYPSSDHPTDAHRVSTGTRVPLANKTGQFDPSVNDDLADDALTPFVPVTRVDAFGS